MPRASLGTTVVSRGLLASLALFALLVGSALGAADDKPGPPEVAIQIISETEGAEPGESLAFFLSITNRSAARLDNLSFQTAGWPFSVALPKPPASLAPFGSAWGNLRIAVPRQGVSFGKHLVPILLQYHWQANAASGVSVQTATAPVEVRRWLDEEAKGLPGGTAALFSFLFPIIPAFLAFQFLDRLRQKKGLHLPTFDSDYIVPAFFIALLVNSLPLFSSFRSLALSPPKIVLFSLLFGTLWPLARWIWDLVLEWLCGFRESDSPEVYLRKALLSPWSPRPYVWISGKVGEETEPWSGILLRQPGGISALGASLVISHRNEQPQEVKNATETLVEAVNQEGSLRSRWRLLRRVRSFKLKVAIGDSPARGVGDAAQPSRRIAIVGAEIEGLQRTASSRRNLLGYSD